MFVLQHIESTANVLSVNIVSDSTALVSSPLCTLKWAFFEESNAAEYSRKCYKAQPGADGCNFFKNQSLAFTEKPVSTCPFPGKTCALDENPALLLDTGYIDAKYLGINSKIPYHFRRTTTCAPLKPDGELLSVEIGQENLNHIADGVGDFYGRQRNFTLVTTESDIKIINGVCHAAENFPNLTSSEYLAHDFVNTSFISILLFDSYEKMYERVSHDPVFPAATMIQYPRTYDNWYGWHAWQNNDLMPGILGCIDNASIWDPTTGEHWGYSGNASGEVLTTFPYTTQGHDVSVISFLKVLEWARNFLSNWGDTNTTPTKPTKGELVRTLLSRTLWKSNIFSAYSTWRSLELHTYCRETKICLPLRWEDEVRYLFRSSLAQIQYNVLDTVRGTYTKTIEQIPREPYDLKERKSILGVEDGPDIPPGFEGICSMVKFNSVGWRNVSVWGFLGLLFLAGGISLGSCRTEEEKLLLVVGFEKVVDGLRWLYLGMVGLPWAMAWATVMGWGRKGVRWVQRTIGSLVNCRRR
ncbi:MAG: hypothetical protein Q9213_004715 [Squamulea squamosa]